MGGEREGNFWEKKGKFLERKGKYGPNKSNKICLWGRGDQIFFFDESKYYSYIRKFSNPNPNIIRDFKKDSNIIESPKRFEYSIFK